MDDVYVAQDVFPERDFGGMFYRDLADMVFAERLGGNAELVAAVFADLVSEYVAGPEGVGLEDIIVLGEIVVAAVPEPGCAADAFFFEFFLAQPVTGVHERPADVLPEFILELAVGDLVGNAVYTAALTWSDKVGNLDQTPDSIHLGGYGRIVIS